MASNLSEFYNARDLLLQAVGCKAEKRHEKIMAMVPALQVMCISKYSIASERNLKKMNVKGNHENE